jgi:hypothetical protein
MITYLSLRDTNDLETGLLSPISEASHESTDIQEKRDYSFILNRKTAAVVGALCLGTIGCWNIAVGADSSLFRSPNNANLKPSITAQDITISRGLYGSSGVFLVAASVLTLSTAFFDEIPSGLKKATQALLCCGTVFEAAPIVFLL